MNQPSPSEVRTRVCEELVLIGARVAQLQRALRACEQVALCRATLELCELLERHLEFEQTALMPLLEDADAWGEARVEALGLEHEAQRQIIRDLREEIDGGALGAAELVDEIGRFAATLECELLEEERVVLTGDPLDEACVRPDQTDG